MTLFARTLERYRKDHADRLPFLNDSPPADLPDLLRRLSTLQGEAFTAALQLVSDLKDREAVPVLIDLLAEGDPQQAEPLAHVIATIGGRRACPGLLRVLVESDQPQRRWAALYGLTWLMDSRAFRPLLKLFRDPREPASLRAQAAEALTYLLSDVPSHDSPHDAAIDAFLAGLDDASTDVQFWSVYALGTLQARRALPKLRLIACRADEGLTSSGNSVRDEAQDAIQVIEQGYHAQARSRDC